MVERSRVETLLDAKSVLSFFFVFLAFFFFVYEVNQCVYVPVFFFLSFCRIKSLRRLLSLPCPTTNVSRGIGGKFYK